MPAYFPILLITHIVLAVSLFLPSILLPFALRTRRAAEESPHGLVRFLLWMQAHGTLIIGVGLALNETPLFEAYDHAGDPAGREHSLSAEAAHAQSQVRGADKGDQDAVVGE